MPFASLKILVPIVGIVPGCGSGTMGAARDGNAPGARRGIVPHLVVSDWLQPLARLPFVPLGLPTSGL